MNVGAEQIVRSAGRGLRIGVDQFVEHRQIKFRVINRVGGIGRRRPRKTCSRLRRRATRELVEAGQAAFRRAQNFKRVERRHSRTALVEIDARIGKHRTLARRTRRNSEREPLRADATLDARETRTQARARRIGKNRILGQLARKHPLGETGDDYDVEIHSARASGRSDEHRAVAADAARSLEAPEPIVQYQLHLVESDRADRRHRLELRERGEHRFAIANREINQRAQKFQPVGPSRVARRRLEHRENRNRHFAEMGEVKNSALDARCVRFVIANFRETRLELVAQTREPRTPPIGAADHRRVDQQSLPSPRRARRSFNHGNRVGDISALDRRRIAFNFKIRLERHRREFRIGGNCRLVFARAIGVGHLRERKILREAARREIFRGTAKQREHRAAAGLGAPRAAREVSWDISAGKRLLQVGRVADGVVQQHGDSIEGDAAPRLGIDSARDLDALVHLARRRNHCHGFVHVALDWSSIGE